jgi:ubiquinone/menaquinone biosynthesis C-methylase UbiE
LADEKEFWKEQSKKFDAAADYYDRYRPGYPEGLFYCILMETNLPSTAKILEIGAGSGKATRKFVEQGYELHCIEPGANLAAAGMENFRETGKVQYSICRFENWDAPEAEFDFAFSAQAFHPADSPSAWGRSDSALS